ncbi:hypothetical protein JOQ06_005408 [Pogonophryne albipinna]|uniref:PiggyBac transposable element-derived protein domain-containing protein n=1 Tax=Pogonophryne albipinna TaxID=1090488 RepID=A0AAD6FQ90_9TELE|nr:hypothetical protein JOQ06_005408 [Pogonophryne albipinna]
MNVTSFYASSRKKRVELALPVDVSEDELEISSDEDELQAHLQGEYERDENYEPENEDGDENEDQEEDQDEDQEEDEDQDEDMDQDEDSEVPLQPTPKRANRLEWKNCRNILPVPKWKGSLPKATERKSPIEYFRDDLLTKTCIKNMVDQTNLYAVQCDPGKPLNVTCYEIEQFIGICFYMSIYGLP